MFSSKKLAETTHFYSVFRVRAFWAKLSKKGNFGHPLKKRNMRWPEGPPHLAINPPYLLFLFLFFGVFLFFGFLVFWFFWRV